MADNHGNTPAAWTAVVVGLLGFTVGGIGVMFTPMNRPLFWSGVVIALVGLVLYFLLDKIGFGGGHVGTSGHPEHPEHPDGRR